MRREAFAALLDERVLLGDGAMATRLYEFGIDFDDCFDLLNVERPELVRTVHQSYVEAGADFIETNTFGSNRYRLAHWGLEGRLEEIVRAGVVLAKEAIEQSAGGWPTLVAGSIGPLGKPLAPVGKIALAEARSAFRETAQVLVDAGVDLIVLETFVNQIEALEALAAVREVSRDIAVVAHLTFNDEAKTAYGNKPEEVARALTAAGADAVGANCSVGPRWLDDVLDRMRRVPEARISLMPNAGLPQVVDGRCLYLASPTYMADYAVEFAERGARIVGGCCGTAPEHIAAMREKLGLRAPVLERVPPRATVESAEEEPEPVVTAASTSSFAEKLARGDFVVSVEIDPPRGIDATKLIDGAALCKANGVDAINVADSPLARARMSPLALCTLIRQHVDIEIILHLSCRDRNVLGLQSESMGAHALGIRSILAVTGDPPQVGDYPDARGVFEVDSIGLVGLLNRLNNGQDLAGKALKYRTHFLVGVASNPTAVDLAVEVDRWHKKAAAGVDFTMTQPIYEVDVLDRWLDVTRTECPVLVGILPLRNGRHAEFLHNEVPGMHVPKEIRERMHKAGDRGPEEGVLIAREFLGQCRDRVQGAYLMPPFDRFEMAVDVIKG